MHKAAVLSLSFLEPQLLLSGGFDKKVKMFDIRDKNAVGKDISTHVKAVLAVQCAGNMVYTGSDDRTVRLWDIRRPNEELIKLKVYSLNDGETKSNCIHFILHCSYCIHVQI